MIDVSKLRHIIVLCNYLYIVISYKNWRFKSGFGPDIFKTHLEKHFVKSCPYTKSVQSCRSKLPISPANKQKVNKIKCYFTN